MNNRIARNCFIDFLFLLLVLGLSFLPYLPDSVRPVHDSASNFQVFYVYYNEFYINNQFPLWFPWAISAGIQSTFLLSTEITPALNFVTLVGKLFNVENVLHVYKTGIFLEELTFLFGVYLLSRRFYRHRQTAVFVCVGAIFSIFWLCQIQTNFHIYYLIPFVFFFIVKFFDSCDFRYLWVAGIVAVITRPGTAILFLPVHLFIFLVFFASLYFLKRKKGQLGIGWGNFSTPSSFLFLIFFVIFAAAYVDYTIHCFNYIQLYRPGRNPDGSMPLNLFLSHNRDLSAMKNLWEFVYAAPRTFDLTFYIGLIPLLFLFYALVRPISDQCFKAILITALFALLFTLSYLTNIATLTFYTIPKMEVFRVLAYVRTVAKIFILLASGFGLDHYLDSPAQYPKKEITGIISNEALLTRIGFLMIIVILLLDKGSFPYPLENGFVTFPYEFHFFALFILIFLVIHIRNSGLAHKTSKILVLFYLLEMTSYQFVLIQSWPEGFNSPMPSKESKSAKEYDIEAKNFIKSVFGVRKYVFSGFEVNQPLAYLHPERELAMRYFGSKSWLIHAQFHHTPSKPEFSYDYLTLSYDRLIRTWLGYRLDEIIIPDKQHFANNFVANAAVDARLGNALGYSIPRRIRLYDQEQIHFENDMESAAKYIRDSLYSHPELSGEKDLSGNANISDTPVIVVTKK